MSAQSQEGCVMKDIKAFRAWFRRPNVSLGGSLRRRILVTGVLFVGTSLLALGANSAPVDPISACANILNIVKFPVTRTQITLAKWNPVGTTSANGVALPDHCQIRGVINQRTGVDGYPYGDMFEVRLPAPSLWNGRYMFQGGGGTEGSVPAATGTAGTLSPTLARGWTVASQDGGHENSQLPFSLEFALDPQAVADHAYRSIQVVTLTAKFMINTYYGKPPDYSYSV